MLFRSSRDEYGTTPTGGYITGWGHSADFDSQKNGRIKRGSAQATCYVQDFYDVSADGASATKRNAVLTLLRFTTEQNTNSRLWAINHTSGYTTSSSDGNRDNAVTQNTAVIDFLAEHSGPTGIIVMDFAATDRSGSYDVNGQRLAQAIIDNNFRSSDYARAIAAISSGKTYRVFTMHNEQKCWLTADGHLTTDLAEAGQFVFRKVKGEEYGYGFKLMKGCFTNPDLNNGNVVLTPGCIRPNTQSTPRDTWEAQVFLLNDDGFYAIRATNAAGGDSSWALTAKTFWTVVPDDASPLGISPAYSFDRAYIWQIEEPNPDIDGIGLTPQPPLLQRGGEAGAVYDLSGRLLSNRKFFKRALDPRSLDTSRNSQSAERSNRQISKGLYIIDGRKVVVQ